MRNVYVMVMGIVMGCAVHEPEPESVSVTTSALVGESDQGPFLVAEAIDDLRSSGTHYKLDGTSTGGPTPVPRVRAIGGALSAFDAQGAPLGGTSFQGMLFDVPGTGEQVEITGLAGTQAQPRYLARRVTANGFVDYCRPGEAALATSGYWDTTGAHIADDTTITLSCEHAVITKCWTWGYRPGPAPTNGTATDPWFLHLACTRMARADYCGDDTSHTYEGTSILIRDKLVNAAMPDLAAHPLRIATAWPAQPSVYFFEAAWGPDHATCLSHERWEGLPIGGYCAATLPDPRLGGGAKYCEELHEEGVLDDMGLVFNASRVGQLYLKRWSNGTDEVVTVRGTPHREPPFPFYTFREQIGLVMRNPPSTLTIGDAQTPGDLLEVDLLKQQSDRVVSLPGVPSGAYASVAFEGYVYTADPDGTRLELFLFQHQTTLEYVTSTHAPSKAFTEVGSIGYIDAVPL